MTLDGCITFCLSIYRYFGCFHLLAIVNYATVSMGVQITISVPAFNSFGYTPRRASQGALVVKNPFANPGDIRYVGLIPGSGRSPGKGMESHFSKSCLENPMDRGGWWATVQRVAKSWTRLKRLSTHSRQCLFYPV